MNSQTIKVLLVEDDPAYSGIIQDAMSSLAHVRFQIACVERLAEAVQRLQRDAVDVVLLDLLLPDSQGLDAFREVHARAPWLPVIILTGVEDENLALEAVRLGAQEYLVKNQVDARTLARITRYAIERNRVEKSLRESHEFFKLIWENLSDLVAVIDLEGRRLYNSPSYKYVLGDPAELLGTDSFADIHPEDRERIKGLFRETVATGIGREAEYRFLLKDGTIRHIESRGSVIKDEQGRPSKVLVVSRDVTKRKQAEQELREREQFSRLILENVTDLIAVIDREGRRLYNNPAYKALLGDPEAMRGTDSFAEVHPEDRAYIQRVFQETIATGAGQRTEYRFMCRDGSVRYVESVGSVIKDDAGQPSKVVVVSRDITEHKHALQALQESEQRYKRLLASTTDYLYTVQVRDAQPVSTTHGPGCVAVTGYSAADYAADPYLWYRMIDERDRPAVMDQAAKVLAGEAAPPLEHRIVHQDGSIRWVRNTPVLHRDASGRVVSYDGLISDITGRKRAERLLNIQYTTTRELAESRTLRDAVPKILQVICEGLEWDVGAFWSIDPKASVLRCLELWHTPEAQVEEFEQISRRITFAPGIGLPGRVWTSGQPAWIPDVVRDANFPRAPFAARVGLHGAVGFPLQTRHDLIGVIEFFSRTIQQPEPDLLELFGAIGQQIGQFIERKRTEEALVEERKLLRTLIDNLPDYIYVKDSDSRFVMNNVAHVKVLGAAQPQEVLGKSDFDFFPRELAEQYFADEQTIVETGTPLFNREEPVVDAQGGRRWVLTTKVPLFDNQRRVVGIVGMTRDITERKRVEEARRLSEARLQAILDNTTAVVYLKDPQGRYLLVNRRFEALFNVSRQEIVGKTDFDLFPHGMAELFRQNDQKVLESRVPLEFEEVAPHEREIRSYISIKVPLCDGAGVPYALCGISTDITERKRAEEKARQAYAERAAREEELRQALAELSHAHEELKTAQHHLIQAAKLESVGMLAAGVAHEVKNPLQTILMGLHFLSKNLSAHDENVVMALADMRQAVKRADHIVRALLNMAATNQPDAKPENFNAVIAQVLLLMKFDLTKAHITLRGHFSEALPPVRLDRDKMVQVFINLFLNAIHAMPNGGALTVITWAETYGDPRQLAEFNLAAEAFDLGDTLVFAEVRDSGHGIKEEHLPRIFDPFFTTKSSGVGTGLGLPVTKKIIELHGGAIDIKNDPGGGVRATVILRGEPA